MSAVPKVARPSIPYASNTLDNVASTSLRMSWESVADDEQEKSADETARAAKQRLALVITADMAQDLTGASRDTIAIKEILGMDDVLPISVE